MLIRCTTLWWYPAGLRISSIVCVAPARLVARAIPRDALDHKGSSGPNILPCSDVGDDRVDDHLGDRLVGVGHLRGEVLDQGEAVGWNAIPGLDPEVVEGLADRVDRGDMLHPVGSRPAGNYDARR